MKTKMFSIIKICLTKHKIFFPAKLSQIILKLSSVSPGWDKSPRQILDTQPVCPQETQRRCVNTANTALH